jgi:sulfur-oxidizing protein SoxY
MPTRREVIIGTGAVMGAALLAPRAFAEKAERDEVLRQVTKGAAFRRGRVDLKIPEIAESGLTVPTTITVDSPMTPEDHVRAIHILSEKNPVAKIASFHLGPRAGRARVATNIRLAASQEVMALAEMSDGTFWADTKTVVVTVAACIEGG